MSGALHTTSASGAREEHLPATGTAARRQISTLQTPVLIAAIGVAWLLAIAAEVTGKQHALHHHSLIGGDMAAWAALGLFLVAWQAHLTAMMLPSTMPLVRLFERASAAQPRPGAARVAFLAGYGAVWTAFGLLVAAGDTVVHHVADNAAWLQQQPHLIAGATLMLAGAFQFSDLKDRCLKACRHPLLFLQRHYRRGTAGAFALGHRHGLFCLGCCWALMLVMFAVGIANLAWMAPLALIMVYERTGTHGERAVAPIGVALLVTGTLVLLNPAWLPALVSG
jgi:predicted metal-binding membrane protein